MPGAASALNVSSRISSAKQAQINSFVHSHLAEVLTAAVKEYAQRVEAAGGIADSPVNKHELTATEVVIMATALIRTADLNLFDVAMWFRRPTPPAGGVMVGVPAGGHHG